MDSFSPLLTSSHHPTPSPPDVLSYPFDANRIISDAKEALGKAVVAITQPNDVSTPLASLSGQPPRPLAVEELVASSAANGGRYSADLFSRDEETPEPEEATTVQPDYMGGFPLPRIPLSPLTRALIAATSEARDARTKLEATRAANPNMTSSQLRRMIEDVSIRKDKVQSLERTIETMSQPEYTVDSFDPEFLARQLAWFEAGFTRAILSGLGANQVKLGNLLLMQAVSPGSSLLADLDRARDFNRYLVHTFIAAVLSSLPDRAAVAAGIASATAAHARARTITHLLATSQVLLRTYKCHNAAASIVAALTSPEVRRLRTSWALVEPRAREYLERARASLVPRPVDNPQGEEGIWEGYAAELEAELLLWHTSPAAAEQPGATVLSPWWTPICDSLSSLVSLYSTVPLDAFENTGNPSSDLEQLALTERGTRWVHRWISLTELACGVYSGNRAGIEDVLGLLHLPSAHSDREASSLGKGKNVVTRPRDWNSLLQAAAGQPDEPFQHWLLTRPFFTRRELWMDSLGCEGAVGRSREGVVWIEGVGYPGEVVREDGIGRGVGRSKRVGREREAVPVEPAGLGIEQPEEAAELEEAPTQEGSNEPSAPSFEPDTDQLTDIEDLPSSHTPPEPDEQPLLHPGQGYHHPPPATSDSDNDEQGGDDDDDGDLDLPSVPLTLPGKQDEDDDEKDGYASLPSEPEERGEEEMVDGVPAEEPASAEEEKPQEGEGDEMGEVAGAEPFGEEKEEEEEREAVSLSKEEEEELDRELADLEMEMEGGEGEGEEGSDGGEHEEVAEEVEEEVGEEVEEEKGSAHEEQRESGFETAATTPGLGSIEVVVDGVEGGEEELEDDEKAGSLDDEADVSVSNVDERGSEAEVEADQLQVTEGDHPEPAEQSDQFETPDELEPPEQLSHSQHSEPSSPTTPLDPDPRTLRSPAPSPSPPKPTTLILDNASLDFLGSLGPRPPVPVLSQATPWQDTLGSGDPPPLPPKPPGLSPTYQQSGSPVFLQSSPIYHPPSPLQNPWSSSMQEVVASAPDFEPQKGDEDQVEEMLREMGITDEDKKKEEGRERYGELWDRLAFLNERKE